MRERERQRERQRDRDRDAEKWTESVCVCVHEIDSIRKKVVQRETLRMCACVR